MYIGAVPNRSSPPALLSLRDDEAGAERVAEILGQAQRREAVCFGCFITLMEVLCRV
jgi:ribonuclease VapC